MKIDRSQLTEIKKGETGTGLLIENEGFVSINDKNNKALKESIEKEGDEFHVPYPFKVKAVFQKYGIVNANGRIYPEEVLRREVDKYQLKIKERRSIGECYTPDTLILTETGWKTLADIKDDEKVLTLNPDNNEIEVHSINNKVMYHYKGKMIRIKGRNINDLVTPNHKFPLYNGKDEFVKFITAEEILKGENLSDLFIPNYGNLSESDDKIYIDKNNIEVTEEDYDGDVACVEVPNHIWYCMCNGKCHWTGNCNHPEQATIDLGRIAFIITELHWEEHTLVGEIEIPTTKGFRELGIVSTLADLVAQWILSGIKIGVSSRGVGTVSNSMGRQIVDDNYEIECWDIVSDPSTPGAWIVPDGNTQMYVEGDKSNQNNPVISEKIEKAGKLFNIF